MADWFDYPYNFSNGTKSVTGMASLFQYANAVTHNVFGSILLGLIFIISFFGLGGNKNGLPAALFVSAIFSVLFVRVGLVTPLIPIIIFIMLAIAIIVNASNKYG